ncbi:SRPBCC family protein [Aestuariibius insulae]|uniref:SRPBCC family protein n=1 Tax=Aestuariibius insulae TaxID=2058287 RepID=UPI00345E5BDD
MADSNTECLTPSEHAEVEALVDQTGAGRLHAAGHILSPLTAEEIFPVVTENEQLVRWMPSLEGGTYDDRPERAPIAPGMTRRLSFGGQADVERIVAVELPRLFAYQIIGGFPIDDHLAVLVVTTLETGGTRVSWYQYFRSPRLTGVLQRRQVRRFVDNGMTALAVLLEGERIEHC